MNYSFFHRLKSKKTWWAHIIIINKNVCALKFKFYALNKFTRKKNKNCVSLIKSNILANKIAFK